jgi:ankyrin repeat protein
VQLSRLYTNLDEVFAPIHFNAGAASKRLNVVFAEVTRKKTKDGDSHNLGKTTLIEVLDFLLLKDITSTDHFLERHRERFGDFVFYLEVALHGGGYLEAVEELLSAGADPNARDNRGRTPMHYACDRPFGVNVAKALFTAGGRLRVFDKRGRTPVHLSAEAKTRRMVNGSGDPLRWFAETPELRSMLELGTPAKGQTPLHLAATKGMAEATQMLLDAGVSRDRRDREGRLPVHLAASANEIGPIKLLLKDRNDLLEVRDRKGRTVLHRAAVKGRTQTVKFLLNRKADRAARSGPYDFWKTPAELARAESGRLKRQAARKQQSGKRGGEKQSGGKDDDGLADLETVDYLRTTLKALESSPSSTRS